MNLSLKGLIPAGEIREDPAAPDSVPAGNCNFAERELLRKDGSILPVETNSHLLPDGNILAVVRDLSGKRKAEEKIRHISRLHATLGLVTQTIVRAKDTRALFRSICEIAVEDGGLDLAMMATLDEQGKKLTLEAFDGSTDTRPYEVIDLGTPAYAKSLPAQAISTGRAVSAESADGCESLGVRNNGRMRSGCSAAAVPFRSGKRVAGVLSLVSEEPGYFGEMEETVLDAIGMNISFALDMITLDVERSLAEGAMRENEELYRSIYENTRIGLYRMRPDGTMLMANPALVRMLGFESFDQLAERALSRDGFEPDYSREEFMRRLEREDEISGLESAWTRADGRAIYVRESARAARDIDGNTLYYEGTIEDISERKIVEQALRTSEDRFRTLFENAPVSLWEEDFSEVKKRLDELRKSGVRDIREYLRNDINGLATLFDSAKVLSVNKTTLSMYHAASVLQLMRMSGSVTNPESGPAHLDTLAMIWEGKTEFDAETVIKTLTGEKRYVILKWKVVPGFERDYSKMLVSLSDITPLRNFERELENSREMYRELVENIDEIIFSLDNKGTILYVSPAAERYFAATARGLIGSPVSEFVYREDLPAVLRQFVQQRKGNTRPFECRFVVKGGAIRWAFVHPVAIFKRGEFEGIRGSVLDITDRKEAEVKSLRLGEELRALASGLQSAREEERISIAREIHDELGQGLTTLKLGISLVRKSLMEGGSSRKFAQETKELLELSHSVDDLVNSVRKISGSLRPEVLDELGIAEAIHWYSSQLSRQSGIKCLVRTTPQKIRLDEQTSTVLFRICQEALTNVVRHAGADRVEISLSKRSGKVRLVIKDDGCGIEEEKIQDKRSIGLLGMKERAMSLGGELTVGKSGAKGTTVKAEFRLTKEPSKIKEGRNAHSSD